MKTNQQVLFLVLLAAISNSALLPAQSDFQLSNYQQFLRERENISAEDLYRQYPSPSYRADLDMEWTSALYREEIDAAFQLTADEVALLNKHGFVVSERLRNTSFFEQFLKTWKEDLPVFISTDAILHAFHFYYDGLVQQIESGALHGLLTDLLIGMHDALPMLDARYGTEPGMGTMLRDVDVYLTVPLRLLQGNSPVRYPENEAVVEELLQLIDQEQPAEFPLFSESCKLIDFSQFRTRGHYTNLPILEAYFKAMMWLGRMEIYLTVPVGDPLSCPKQTNADMQRQVIDAALIQELVSLAEADKLFGQIESTLEFLVGEQDNVSLPQLRLVLGKARVENAAALLDTIVFRSFQDTLWQHPFAGQRILSQVLARDPLSTEAIQGASAFLLFGQRFVLDAHVTGNVVYDKIKHEGDLVCRLYPSTLDLLFTLGNNPALQLLESQLEEYHYAGNLGALRYLVDHYGESFWHNSVYTSWLGAIRTLNSPASIDHLPGFMQTGAWWQQKMNTQLSSWTELRHDHLLYAKPSYGGALACSFPAGYVEPVPEFFVAMSEMAARAASRFEDISFGIPANKQRVLDYFAFLQSITAQLGGIATKELQGLPLDAAEQTLIETILFGEDGYLGPESNIDGWYAKLLFGPAYVSSALTLENEDGMPYTDYLVVDYHTTPTDCSGAPKGYVLHSGTGPVDVAVIMVEDHGGQTVAFTGPVMSHYEYVTTNFQRLDDEQWEFEYLSLAQKPAWTNIYTADTAGVAKLPGGQLWTGGQVVATGEIPAASLSAANFPNPFRDRTVIRFTIPYGLGNQLTELCVYDSQGHLLKRLLNEKLPPGTYLTAWDARDSAADLAISGSYIYRIRCGELVLSGKMIRVMD